MKNEVLVYDGLQRCPYLPGRVARMPLYRQLYRLTPSQADARFAAAERRVGIALYHTACPACTECQGIRIPVNEFRPSRSQRRVLRRWPEEVRMEIGPATLTPEKVELFNLHKLERGLVEDDDEPMSASGYHGWLVQSCFETMEMRYLQGDRLIGVGILDLGRRAASSVYFYFDPAPEIARLSPGVFSVLEEIDFCRKTGRDYLYLGLYVDGCAELNYKGSYFPHERLVKGKWVRVDEPPRD